VITKTLSSGVEFNKKRRVITANQSLAAVIELFVNTSERASARQCCCAITMLRMAPRLLTQQQQQQQQHVHCTY